MTVRLLRRLRACRSGSAAVEFSFIAPLMILMGAGVYELTHLFNAQSGVNKVASQFAIAYADCVDLPAGTCRTELNTYSGPYATKNLEPLLPNPWTLQMFQVAVNGGAASVTYAYPAGAALSTRQAAAATSVISDGHVGVVVTVNYTYTLDIFPAVLTGVVPSSIPMTYTVAQLKS